MKQLFGLMSSCPEGDNLVLLSFIVSFEYLI